MSNDKLTNEFLDYNGDETKPELLFSIIQSFHSRIQDTQDDNLLKWSQQQLDIATFITNLKK